MTDYRVNPGEVEEDQFTAAIEKTTSEFLPAHILLSPSERWPYLPLYRLGTRSMSPCSWASGLRRSCCSGSTTN